MVKLTRRHMIRAGAAAGLLGAVGRPAAAQIMTPLKPTIDAKLKARALVALAANRSRIPNDDVIGIADFSRPSRDPRFYIVDLRSGMVTQHLCAHGRGSDPDHSGWLELFSNAVGSEATSSGAYVTGDAYFGKYGQSMRLTGLDYTNSNADARAIVIHSAWYAEPRVVEEYGKLGRSEGCFALSHASLEEVLARLGPGHFLYADRLEA